MNERTNKSWGAWCMVAGLGAGLAAGCGGVAPSMAPLESPVQSLPSEDALRSLAQRPVPQVQAREVVTPEDWTFDGQLVAPKENGEGDEGKAAPAAPAPIAGLPTEKGATARPAMQCVAEQVGRFYAQHRSLPGDRLGRYFFARCGVPSQRGMAMYVNGLEGPEDATDEEVLAQLLPQAKELIPTASANVAAGTWLVRQGKQAVIAWAGHEEAAELAVTPVDASGTVRLTGRLREPAASLRAAITQGPTGSAPCAIEGQLPSFTVACTLAEGDDQAWIQIARVGQGRLLSEPIATYLAHREGPSRITYTKLPQGSVARTGDDARQRLLTQINALRAQAGLQPVALAPGQSALLDPVAPHFFAANQVGDAQTADLVALGSIAGSQVTGAAIRDANFVATFSRAPSVESWLAEAFELPLLRRPIMGATTDQLAIGVALNAPMSGMGFVIASFDQYDPATRDTDLRAAVARLNALRAARGRAPATIMPGPFPALDEAERRIQGGEHPQSATTRAVNAMGRGGGWMLTLDPAAMEFPDAILDAPSLTLALQLFHHRLEGNAWGFFVAIAVTMDDLGGTRSASRSAPPRL